jgi:hypothetical protein
LIAEFSANEIYDFIEKNQEFEIEGEDATIYGRCYSITISRNR